MFDRQMRLLVAFAILVGALPSPLLAQGTIVYCHSTNIVLSNAYAGAVYVDSINGYSISGACDLSFDCSTGNFGTCEVCLLMTIDTDPAGDGSYTGQNTVNSLQTSSYYCGSTGHTNSFGTSSWPTTTAGLPANLAYKVRYYAVADSASGCPSHVADFDILSTVTETTPPF